MHSIAARNIRSAVPRGVSAKLGFDFLAEGAGRASTVCFLVMRCDLGFWLLAPVGTGLIKPRDFYSGFLPVGSPRRPGETVTALRLQQVSGITLWRERGTGGDCP